MSKRDLLMEGLANVRESMGDFGGAVPGAPAPGPGPGPGPRALPAHLRGVTRSKDVSQIEVGRIVRDESQPREEFDPDALERLSASLKQRGQLQPIRVRWSEERGAYMIICGERRWRAAQMAGLATLSCVVVDGPMDPDELLAVQLIENCLREDLRPIEQARSYKRLMEAHGWSARHLASELAIHHAQVVRATALLELPEAVQQQVEQGALAPASAYEVSKVEGAGLQEEIARAVVEGGLRRSEVGELVQAIRSRRPAPAARPEPVSFDVGGATVKVSWKKADGPDLVKALKLALKLAQQRLTDDQAA